MTKSKLTKKLESKIMKETLKLGTFGCLEVKVGFPSNKRFVTNNEEIIDYMTYNTNGEIRCYEIKSSLADLNSGSHVSFVGHYNYFVMPRKLWLELLDKDLVTRYFFEGVGLYLLDDDGSFYLERKAKKKFISLGVSTILLESMLRSLSREANRYYKLIKKI